MFLYTLDQIATLLHLQIGELKSKYIYFDGRSTGEQLPSMMLAQDISPEGEKPEWRVQEAEFIRWMRHKKFRIYEPPI